MYKNEYIKMMDDIADSTCNVSAEDILARANTIKMENTMENKTKKGKRRFMGATVACATFILASAVVLASTQKEVIAGFFRNIFHDEVTAKIVDKGYWLEIDQTVDSEDGNYSVKYIAISGDCYNPVILADIRVNDDDIAAKYDTLEVFTYSLGEEVYNNELGNYGTEAAFALQDENDKNLYHLSTRGTPYWFQEGGIVVLDVSGFAYVTDENRDFFEKSNALALTDEDFATPVPMDGCQSTAAIRIQVPEQAIAPTSNQEFERDVCFTDGVYDFYPVHVEYSSYATIVEFVTDYTDDIEVTPYPNDPGGYIDGQPINDSFNNIAANTRLVVDGQEFSATTAFMVYYDEERNVCGDHMEFPGIDFESATSVVLKYGDTSFTLK